MELPKRNHVAQQQRQNNEEKAKRQAATDIEAMQVKSAIAKLFRPSTKFAEHLRLLLLSSIARPMGSARTRIQDGALSLTFFWALLGFTGLYRAIPPWEAIPA
jgi:hypothetical protein